MELLSPGEKIRRIRKELGLKQEDITNEEVSKSLISMIEKNKRALSWKTAKIIANCLNKYYRNTGYQITPEYLMETEQDLVKKDFVKTMNYLYSIMESDVLDVEYVNECFEKLMVLIRPWGLKKEMIELITLRGKFYCLTYQYNEALKDFCSALEYYLEEKDYSEVARIYNQMGMINHMLMRIDQALTYYTKAYDIASEHNIINRIRIKIEAIYNLILCYRNIQRYDMALQYVIMFKEIEWNHPMYDIYNHQVMLMEGNTYREIKNFEKAEKIYFKLLQKARTLDNNTLFLVYESCSIHYREQGQVDKALNYIDKALKMKSSVKASYIPNILIAQAKCQMLLKRSVEAINTLKDGLEKAEKIYKNEMIIDFHFTLAQVYIRLDKLDIALKYIQDIEKVIIENNIEFKMYDLYSFYSEIYCRLGNVTKGLEYITKTRKNYLDIVQTS